MNDIDLEKCSKIAEKINVFLSENKITQIDAYVSCRLVCLVLEKRNGDTSKLDEWLRGKVFVG